jgi:hypothetical protein
MEVDMPVEDHPFFPKWKQCLENLIETKAALKDGRASQRDVDKAQAEYDKISDEI